MRGVIGSIFATIVLTLIGCSNGAPPPPPATSESPQSAPATKRVVGPLTEAEAKALATMNTGLKEYLEMHHKLEKSLPKLSKDSTPEQIDQNQRALQKLVQATRATAKQGDIFTPDAQPVIKRLLADVFEGLGGKELKASIMDHDTAPTAAELTRTVNGVYPDTVPFSTVPPQVLQTLPKLTEELEYRFIGDSLILLDVDAHVIADFIEHVIPT